MSDDQADQAGPQDRLEALEDDIAGVRKRVEDRGDDRLDDGERTFVEEGEADEGQPVDDTIVPPG